MTKARGRTHAARGQTQTKHEWDGMSDGVDRDRSWQMTTSMTARHSHVVTSRGTEHSSHESATCHKTDQISSSRINASLLCARASPPVR